MTIATERRISRWQRVLFLLRFLPLFGALLGADWLGPKLPRRWPRRKQNLQAMPGISIIVAERGTPDLLVTTLAALAAACTTIEEPVQIIIVVNGYAADAYADLRATHADFEWQFHDDALGYDGAIAAGLAVARYAWTYLLNSDMRLDVDALERLLPYRQPQVFAITSQIFFEDASRRREETGWSDFHPHHDVAEMYERTPEPGNLARGNLYPGGGSSLCRTDLLRRYVRDAHEYHPFYWEDADWGVRAWNEGWEVLFCPGSHVWHQHRATINRFYPRAEIDRIVLRNAHWFDIRHAWTQLQPIEHLRRIAALAPQYWSEYSGFARALRTLRLRTRARRTQRLGLRYDKIAVDRYYGPSYAPPVGPDSTAWRPRVLIVSPFALFPPAHGGARRIAELVTRLADSIDFILLGDERSLYNLGSEPWLANLRATHLVEGRGDGADERMLTLPERMHRHAWPELRQELDRLIALYDPDIVQIEFMELAYLARQRRCRARWLLALHDVYLDGGITDAGQIAAMAGFDALSACSIEDLQLLSHPRTAMIGNGAPDRRAACAPSPPHQLLFMGPFRYVQNKIGILQFIDQVWPLLKAQFPDLRLCILGGPESDAVVRSDARLRMPGIDVVSNFVDPTPYLQQCSLTINPQTSIRGSSIKLIESLLAGRVCVSTSDGARGFSADGLQGLVIAPDVGSMTNQISQLLRHSEQRHALERADDAQLDGHTWDAIAARQFALYRQLLAPA